MAAPVNLKNLTIDNITENVHVINSQSKNVRLKYILERAVTHLHDLARETRLSTDEWMTAILFLTEVGKISSDVRQVRTFYPHGNVWLTFDFRNSFSYQMSWVFLF